MTENIPENLPKSEKLLQVQSYLAEAFDLFSKAQEAIQHAADMMPSDEPGLFSYVDDIRTGLEATASYFDGAVESVSLSRNDYALKESAEQDTLS